MGIYSSHLVNDYLRAMEALFIIFLLCPIAAWAMRRPSAYEKFSEAGFNYARGVITFVCASLLVYLVFSGEMATALGTNVNLSFWLGMIVVAITVVNSFNSKDIYDERSIPELTSEEVAEIFKERDEHTYSEEFSKALEELAHNEAEVETKAAKKITGPNLDDAILVQTTETSDSEPVKEKTPDRGMKDLMSKMISCVLNYPVLANDTVELRVRNLPKSNVLLELIHSAQIDDEISQQELIKPFEVKPRVYSRLQQLCVMEPSLSAEKAKDELIYALIAAEEQHKKNLVWASISTATTSADEKRIMEDIQRRKTPKSNWQ